MALVAGVDSSTQSCKVVVRDTATGKLVRHGWAPHPSSTEVDPWRWWEAFQQACTAAGGLEDVAAISIAAQQHGLVCLDDEGEVVRHAILWNDTRSASQAEALVAELGGPKVWAHEIGSVPVASFTISKLRWVAEHEPDSAARTAAICLPHDWLTWTLLRSAGSSLAGLEALTTDRSDASGTGYWSTLDESYRPELLERAFGRNVLVPKVLGAAQRAALGDRFIIGPGAGDNAAAALVLGPRPGDVIISVGTSGTVFACSDAVVPDTSGAVAGFADATGRYLPLVCTLNAARVLDVIGALLGVDQEGLSRLALAAPAGAGGLVLLPYFEGERTPNLPKAAGELHGMTPSTATATHLARAAVEGVLCSLADALDLMISHGVEVNRLLLVGGGSRSEAVCRLAPSILGHAVLVPPSGEYVADGAALQAMWTLEPGEMPSPWPSPPPIRFEAKPEPVIRERYREIRERALETADWIT